MRRLFVKMAELTVKGSRRTRSASTPSPQLSSPVRRITCPPSARQVFAGASDGELAVLHALGSNEFIRDAFDDGGLAPNGEYFQAVVVVQMDVERGDDDFVVVVLDVGEGGLDVLFVVVVKECDGAGNFLVAELLMMLDEVGADHVCDGKGAIVIAFLCHHAIELLRQTAWNRNAEAHSAFFFDLFHAGEGTTPLCAVNGLDAVCRFCLGRLSRLCAGGRQPESYTGASSPGCSAGLRNTVTDRALAQRKAISAPNTWASVASDSTC
jgi:hypothetical protein